ncbi:unnamed protein product [Symbiodinium necroappetens]|uniref:Uncharacterized protein n=1 Tax=Symbiodinium necroappetens TaxID=1628268 RepID=A0A812WSC8_9DINO|nr:unnamed protein product [Symbiodinium necroappetens]
MQPEHNSSRSVAAEIDSSHSSAIAMDSAVAAHALADAAAQVLVDDKEMRRGLVQTLSRLGDRSEQLAAIDALSEKALGGLTGRRAATPAPLRPPSSWAADGGPAAASAAATEPLLDSNDEPFIIWSPLVDSHLGVKHVEELRTKDRRSLILEIPRLKTSSSLPSLNRAGEALPNGSNPRQRSKALPDYAPHLRRSALNMGMPSQLTTTYMAQCSIPVQSLGCHQSPAASVSSVSGGPCRQNS